MRSLLPRAAIASLAVALMASGAFAQGVVDQQNDPSGGSGFGCGSPPILNGTVHQGFVPSTDNLVAVELRLMAGSAFPSGGTTTTARIRDGSSSGTVLGEATASVSGPLSANTQILVRFDFTEISLTAGNTYLIEWVTPPTTELMWVGQGGDPYPAGTAYSCSGNTWPVSGTDFNFVTYAAEPEPTTTDTPAPTEEPGCGSYLDKLREQVDELGLTSKYKRCSLERLLDAAEKHLAKGKAKAASANVFALECQVRVLAKLGVITDDQANAIHDTAEAFRDCLGVELASKHHDWHWCKKDKGHHH
ncbi:MAG TPA: hypothetical protein VFY93_09905 [Planctomycetota bacterium]|nr:hypothetical protein [Planctomycetota bacterium]